jgi:hypothetical protein
VIRAQPEQLVRKDRKATPVRLALLVRKERKATLEKQALLVLPVPRVHRGRRVIKEMLEQLARVVPPVQLGLKDQKEIRVTPAQ